MSELFQAPRLATCDWDDDELHLKLSLWPDVVTIWVDGKAMPFVPVISKNVDHSITPEIVCCKNCQHLMEDPEYEDSYVCKYWWRTFDYADAPGVELDDFCSKGKRKEG